MTSAVSSKKFGYQPDIHYFHTAERQSNEEKGLFETSPSQPRGNMTQSLLIPHRANERNKNLEKENTYAGKVLHRMKHEE